MEKIKVISDNIGKTLTIWLGNPDDEDVCEETADDVVLMKDKKGKVIGIEILNYEFSNADGMSVETILKTGTRG